MQANRPEPSSSRTITETEAGPSTRSSPQVQDDNVEPPAGVLKLRGGVLKKQRQRVVWDDKVVDNEGMGKKKSKICCIYHKPKAFDESSDESSCSSDDEHGHHHDHPHPHRHPQVNGQRIRDGAQVEESPESESDGGAGNGGARPARKSRRPNNNGRPKVNKYDVQPKPDGSASGNVNGVGKGKGKS